MRVLVVNSGSSSVKLALLDDDNTLLGRADFETTTGDGMRETLREFVASHGRADVIGHRIVHGGADFVEPVVVDEAVEHALRALAELAPLHQARGLAGVDVARDVLPGVPQVACFDTAFHAAMPAEASTYPLPAEWRARWPIRRYGFHGLSHAYAVRRATQLMDGATVDLRIVSCHLGSGASLCAVRGGESRDTTMGFSPLDGLVMASRAGAIDPGLVLWLIGKTDGHIDEIAQGLEERSGLVGLAGGTGDMRDVEARRAQGDSTATLAFDVYLHRLAAEIAAMTPAIDGLDVLVFTGGVGAHSYAVREEVARRLAFLGVGVDPTRNGADRPADRDISAAGAAVCTLVIEAREDLEIARQTRRLLLGAG